MIKFGNRIKELRASLGLNQKEFAARIDVVQASLSGYENDLKQPSLDVLMRISKQFNVSIDWLCSNSSTKHFITGADIIDFILELQNIHMFDFDIIADENKSCIVFNQLQEFEHFNEIFKDFGNNTFKKSDLAEFLKEYSDLTKTLASLNDDEIKQNYIRMWLDKKREHYSHYAVLYEKDYREKTEDELDDAFEDFRKLFASSNSESGDK